MKKTLKKISALVLALAMVVAMSATVFAADMTGQSGVIGEFDPADEATTQNNTVKIYKEITAYNPESTTVNAPAITFNYTITAGEAGKNIYDYETRHDPETNVHAVTKAGVGNPTITGTANGVLALVPGTDTLSASVNGTANRFELTVSFDGIDYNTVGTGAGVYRYVIDETTTETVKNASGIKEGDVANTLYMDVYVDGDGKIYGYVLFTNNVDIDARTSEQTAATTAGKTEGFVGSKADDETYDSEAASIADKYYTFNLTVGKEVKNDNYSISTKHQFPFEITLANTTVTANVLPIMTINDATLATQTALSAGEIAGTWNPTIASGGTITYVGIPTGTTVTIKEKNDVVGVMYSSVSAGADDNKNAELKDINTNEWSNEATVDCNATALKIATENHTDAEKVLFTNTLLQISPTGVVLRFGPYALMLGAGIALLILTIRRKSLKDED